MRCSDCAHWVTHRCRDRNRGPSDNRFEPVSTEAWDGFGIGECDRASANDAPMEAICTSEQIGAELFTAPTFGCVEFAPAPTGWDHHRFHRRAVREDGRPNWVIDDLAHLQGRF